MACVHGREPFEHACAVCEQVVNGVPVRHADSGRIEELLAVFGDRDSIASIGQLSKQQETRLRWGIKRGLVASERRPWTGPLVGTCIKTFYVKAGTL